MEIPLLPDVIIILGLAVIVILIFQQIKLPTILGFLMTGLIAGPSGLNLVKASHEVEVMSEIGVILLLFIIGLEFSLSSLIAIKKYVLIGGATQVFLTILVANLAGYLLGFTLAESIFLGFLFCLSSTAIVLKLLQERREINTPHGKIVLAILIFQDIVVVLMMLLVPLLAGKTDDILFSLLTLAGKGLLIIGFVYVSARYIVPKLLFLIARTKSKELFLISTIVICLAVAFLTSSMGLSLSLGAFLAGLIISESEYSHQTTSNIIPFREVFSSFFFVSIGMLLNVSFLLEHIWLILFFTFLTFFGKTLIATLSAYVLGFPLRTSLLVGFSLFQVGEFAFILSKSGLENALISPEVYQYFLSVSLLTMALTPFIVTNSPRFSAILLKGFPKKWQRPATIETKPENELDDHIVIIGFGINGQHIARAAKQVGIPYTILELNAETVMRERRKGEPIMYGDAVHPVILSHLGITRARLAVVAISDAKATKQIVANIRQMSNTVHIIARTTFMTEMEENLRLGADEVIPEELETSIEIFTRVLNKYLVPKEDILEFIESIRSGNYDLMRTISAGLARPEAAALNLAGMTTAALRVHTDNPDIVGKSLAEADIRDRFEVTVLAIKRETELIEDIHHTTTIMVGDLIYIFGKKKAVSDFEKLLGLPENKT